VGTVCINRREPQELGERLLYGRRWSHRNTPLPTCVPAEIGCSGSNGRYERRSPWKKWTLVSRLSRSLNVIGTDTDRSATYDFLLTIRSNHGLSYRFRDKRRFQSKIANLFHPVYFAPPWNWVPALSTSDGVTGRRKNLTNVTDRRTDTGRQQRPRLRIASRGKNM